jgi:hypothetical protein
MRIYGLDFTSNPSKSKRLILAHCQLDNSTLAVQRLEELNTTAEGDYSKFCDWLAGENGYGGEWVAGIDFPFGLPLEAIERFGWLKHDEPQSWTAYVEELYRDVQNDLEKFRERVESWKKSGKTGKDKRVFLLRHTDRLSGFAGSTPSSPMKVHHQCNPPVGRMFFQGADRLRQAGVCIHPVLPTEPHIGPAWVSIGAQAAKALRQRFRGGDGEDGEVGIRIKVTFHEDWCDESPGPQSA